LPHLPQRVLSTSPAGLEVLVGGCERDSACFDLRYEVGCFGEEGLGLLYVDRADLEDAGGILDGESGTVRATFRRTMPRRVG